MYKKKYNICKCGLVSGIHWRLGPYSWQITGDYTIDIFFSIDILSLIIPCCQGLCVVGCLAVSLTRC